MEKNMHDKITGTDKVEANKETLRDRLGDAVEKVGHKIADAGAPGLGQKIHDLGDKIEKDHKEPSHPHDV